MKKNTPHITLYNYQIEPSQRHIEHKYLNRNSTSGNLNLNIKANFFNELGQGRYQTLEQDSFKNKKILNNSKNYNLNENKFYSDFKNESSYQIGNPKKIYLQEEYKSLQNNENDNNSKQFSFYSQSALNKNYKQIIKNFKENNEEKQYPSNYSYYESKYLKNEKNDSNKNIHNTSKYTNKNNNLKNTIINNKNEYFATEKKPYETNNFKYKNDNISNFGYSASNNKKRNIIIKNTFNISNIDTLDKNKNIHNKKITHPRTPSVNFYSNTNKYSPIKKFDNNKNKYNGNEKNLSSKSPDVVKYKKFVLIRPKIEINMINKRKLNTIEENKNNITESFRTSTETINNSTINTIFEPKNRYNNNFTISIDDTNERKSISKIPYFNTAKKPKNNEQKTTPNKINKKSKIKEIKIIDSNELKSTYLQTNNNKSIIPNQKNKEIENKVNKTNKKEKEYMKELKNIMYDNYTEHKAQIKLNLKDNKKFDNKENSNKNIKINMLSKGRISEKENIKSHTDLKINLTNKYEYNKLNNNKISSFSGMKSFEHINNQKTNDIILSNSRAKNNNNILKQNNSNKKIEIIRNISNTKIETNPNVTNRNSKNFNLVNSISTNKTNTPKIFLDDKNNNNNLKKKPHRNLSEIPKHESRLDKLSNKKSENNEEDWDHVQYKGMRKSTYDARRRPRRKNNNSKNKKRGSIRETFSSTIYIKSSEGLSSAGKNDKGNKKINQDTYEIEKNVNGVLNFNIFGVFDGHGNHGHFVSQFVKKYIIHRIKNHPLIKILDQPKEIYKTLKSKGYEIISNIFIDADTQIQEEKFDSSRSGTTVVLVIQLEEHIICANTGDSRAIAIYDESNDDNLANSKIFRLSYDCKPDLPNEKRRIYESGGVVEKAYYSDADSSDEELIPFRVWAKDEDYPGLAMSRSIGDIDAKKVGVIPNPQFVEYTIDQFSKYLLICSDGIWEFMSNEKAMEISNKFYLRNDPMGLCHELTQSSIKLWEEREIVIDDITVIAVFF